MQPTLIDDTAPRRPHVVILGGGFGGLATAKRLARILRTARHNTRITLIDRNPYHTYTPTLYEVAATSSGTADYERLQSIVTVSFSELLGKYGVAIRQDDMRTIDPDTKTVSLASGEILQWNYLVLALGAETNYFDIPGLQKYALPLKTFDQAVHIRDTILESMRTQPATAVVVGGGGATGVELAGEIQTWLRSKDIQREIPGERTAKVTIVEATPAVLNAFSPRIQKRAAHRLQALGVGVITQTRIATVRKNEIVLESGQKLPFSVLLWTGGVMPSHLLHPLQTRSRPRICLETDMTMRLARPDGTYDESIFAIGDNAYCMNDHTGRPVPELASVAIAQARVAATQIAGRILDTSRLLAHRSATYRPPRTYPTIIPIGGKFAIARVGPITLVGFWGWILKGLVELRYLLSIMPLGRALRMWITGLRVFIQNDRLS